jgi:Nif-specific regulatory protein
MNYSWPGNVRELENCMERAVLTAADDCVHSYNLPPSLQAVQATGSSPVPDGESSTLEVMLANYEREILQDAIRKNNGNQSAAGRQLGLSPRMMNYRMNRLGITKKS